eukprot:g3095.t1
MSEMAGQQETLASETMAIVLASVVVVLITGYARNRTGDKLTSGQHAALAAILAVCSLEFAGLEFVATAQRVQRFASESSGALFDSAQAHDMARSLSLSDARVARLVDVASAFGSHAPPVSAALEAVARNGAAVRAAAAATGALLLTAGKRHVGTVITLTTFALALFTLATNEWTGPPWVAARLGLGRVHDPITAATCAVVCAFTSHAFFQYFAAAWCAVVGWLSVTLAAALLVAGAAHADSTLGLSALTTPLLRDVLLWNPLNANSLAALQARAAHYGAHLGGAGGEPWRAVWALWPSATDLCVLLAAALAHELCLRRGQAALRRLEDRTVRRVLPESLYQLLVPSRVLTPVATGLAFCALLHASRDAVLGWLAHPAVRAWLRPTRAEHEFVFEQTSLGALAGAFFQAGVSVHSLETVGFAQDKIEVWITAMVGATLLLAAAIPLHEAHLAAAGGGGGARAVWPVYFWGWLWLVRSGVVRQLQASSYGAAAQERDSEDGRARPALFRTRAAAQAVGPGGGGDVVVVGGGGGSGFFSGHFDDEDYEGESKSPVTPPDRASRAGLSDARRRRRSKSPARRAR